MRLEELTTPEFSAALATCRTVVIPFGTIEEHGRHLPLGTDTFLAYDVACRVAARRPLFVAPPIHYGVCRSTNCHPGTLTLRTETLKALAIDLVTSLHQQGLHHVVLLSGHAGGTHNAALLDAGEVLITQHAKLNLAVVTEYDLASRAGQHLIETPGDAHAGEIETSRLLHSRPQLVKGTSAAEMPQFPPGILVRDKCRFWPGGVAGDPGKASATKGRAIEDLVADALESLIDRLEQWREEG
jgi:creatinine amidohydrolase